MSKLELRRKGEKLGLQRRTSKSEKKNHVGYLRITRSRSNGSEGIRQPATGAQTGIITGAEGVGQWEGVGRVDGLGQAEGIAHLEESAWMEVTDYKFAWKSLTGFSDRKTDAN
jgi:hypothetical protein